MKGMIRAKIGKKFPELSTKLKKKIPGQKNNQTIYSEFSNLRIHYSKRELLYSDGESCCTAITTMDKKSTAQCNEALLMDTPRNSAKENDA